MATGQACDQRDALLDIFVTETQDLLQQMEHGLLRLEEAPFRRRPSASTSRAQFRVAWLPLQPIEHVCRCRYAFGCDACGEREP